jgi:hypothetical protein
VNPVPIPGFLRDSFRYEIDPWTRFSYRTSIVL